MISMENEEYERFEGLEEYRQGDVLLRRIAKVPHGAKKKDNTIALGEVTGHSHQMVGADVLIKDGVQYIIAQTKAKLTHQEHGQIEVPEGEYEVVRQKEYTPTHERRVQD